MRPGAVSNSGERDTDLNPVDPGQVMVASPLRRSSSSLPGWPSARLGFDAAFRTRSVLDFHYLLTTAGTS